MKRQAVLATALFSITALPLAACGGGESEQDKVRSVATLMANRDPAACDAMTKDFYKAGPEACKLLFADVGRPKAPSVTRVTAEDDRASAVISRDDSVSVITLVKRGDDWKIASLAPKPGSNPKGDNPGPRVQLLRTAREAVDAYLQAIDDEDGPAFCGLLSRRYAVKVTGDPQIPDPIGHCVDEFQNFDWTVARKNAAGVKTAEVTRSGDTTIVRLTSGTRVLVKKYHSRWVIDDIKG